MARWTAGGLAACVVVAGLGACVGGGVTEIAPNQYRVTRTDGGGRYADAAAMQASAAAEAEEFARRHGRVVAGASARTDTMKVGHLTTLNYDFRLATAGEATAMTPAAAPASPPAPSAAPAVRMPSPPPAPVAAAAPAPAPAAPGSPRSTAELVSDLEKLDELRRRGVLTDEEFATLKARLIGAH